MEEHDLIVVEGSPTGASLASLTATAGHQVLLLEREGLLRHQIGESLLPATAHGIFRGLRIENRPPRDPWEQPEVMLTAVSPAISTPWAPHAAGTRLRRSGHFRGDVGRHREPRPVAVPEERPLRITSSDPITYLAIPLSLVLLTAILIAAYLQRGGRRGCIPWSHFDKSDEAARRKETA